nr:MAG TPA: hypothetical protein [Caudoviricetes sp.]
MTFFIVIILGFESLMPQKQTNPLLIVNDDR